MSLVSGTVRSGNKLASPRGAAASLPSSTGAGAAADAVSQPYALDDVLTPLERSVKTYLTDAVSRDLIELLSLMAVERPADAHLWLAQRLLERSGAGSATYTVVRRANEPVRSALAVAKDLERGTVERARAVEVPSPTAQGGKGVGGGRGSPAKGADEEEEEGGRRR
jgi:hypothetical protein